MGEIVYLNNVRSSFLHLQQPHAATANSKPVYSLDTIMPPNDPNYARFIAAVNKVASEKWKDRTQGILQMIQGDRRLRCYGDGSEKVQKSTMQPYPEYVGQVYVHCLNPNLPDIIRADGTKIDPASSMEIQQHVRKFYSGCRVNVAVDVFPQDNDSGIGIRNRLLAVQFHADDTPLGNTDPETEHLFRPVAGAPAPIGSSPGQPATPPPASGGDFLS